MIAGLVVAPNCAFPNRIEWRQYSVGHARIGVASEPERDPADLEPYLFGATGQFQSNSAASVYERMADGNDFSPEKSRSGLLSN